MYPDLTRFVLSQMNAATSETKKQQAPSTPVATPAAQPLTPRKIHRDTEAALAAMRADPTANVSVGGTMVECKTPVVAKRLVFGDDD